VEGLNGRRSLSAGVVAVSTSRIRFDFMFDGARYRPSLPIVPTEINLRRARAQLEGIKHRDPDRRNPSRLGRSARQLR